MNLKSVAALEIILRAKDEASKAVAGVEKKFGGLGGTVGKLAGTVAKVGIGAFVGLGVAIGGAATALGKLAIDAMPIQGIRASFEALNRDAGKTLETLRAGSLGMITDADLMRNYNEAVQLVGKSFADELPNAMQYLSKVSASTGKDMGFLMDSLTTGVGRLSPMILDNLGIQVDLVSANEAYAASIGKTTAELTEEEQKAALMAQVLEKLQANTAALPDITGNAATSMAQLKAQFENAKNGIGEALLPALSALLTPLADLAQKYGPQVVEWAKIAGTWLGENIPKAIEWLGEVWGRIFPQAAGTTSGFGQTVQNVVAGVRGFIQEHLGWVIDWFKDNWPLIQKTAEVVMTAVRTVVEAVLSAVRAFWESHGEQIMDYIGNMWTVIRTIFDTTLKTIFDLVKGVMQLITGDTEGFKATMEGIWTRLQEAGGRIFQALRENLLNLWDGLLNTIRGAWDGFVGWVSDVGQRIVDGIRNGIAGAWDAFAGWLWGQLQGLIDGILGALGIHSPSTVFAEIGENMMAGLRMGILGAQNMPTLALQGVVTGLAAAPAGGGGRYGGLVINNYFGRDAVRSDDDIEAIARRIEEMVAIRGVREW